jgi:hypothetical protein
VLGSGSDSHIIEVLCSNPPEKIFLAVFGLLLIVNGPYWLFNHDNTVIRGEIVMPVTTYQGTVERGRIKLAPNVRLPEKAKVFVVVPDFPENEIEPKFDLAELVARMPPDYEVSEMDFGKPVGREEW